MREARRLLVQGCVQGVGWRPFVYRLAQRFQLNGRVQNLLGQVVITVEGDQPQLDAFSRALLVEAPPLAKPQLVSVEVVAQLNLTGFEILPSAHAGDSQIHLPPDYFMCDDCRREMQSPTDRRYRYPFINCTQCGPRFTLVEQLPYDRARTTLADFALCAACQAEYENPLSRRFHAEPIACPACGPQLELVAADHSCVGDAALVAAIEALQRGEIVAVKGIGGYHLMCDAENVNALAQLRARKNRPHKPLAVMFPWCGDDGLDSLRKWLVVDETAAATLADPLRPNVLLPRRNGVALPELIAPGLTEIGALLPYSPLHYLLLDGVQRPLIATSANISGEPVLTDNAEVTTRLAAVAQAFLHHNRPIARPADDTVVRMIDGKARTLRVGRGLAPLEIQLPFFLPQPLLALGGHSKNTIALAWENRAVLSPHIADLDAPRSLEVFEKTICDFQNLYRVDAQKIVCDAHPHYASSRWASQQNLPLIKVWHHHAHAAALAFEHGAQQTWLTFTWDGVGLGVDGNLWGGETLLGRSGNWQRVSSFRAFKLPGGERAARQPWRSAAALCWEIGVEYPASNVAISLLKQAWQQNINAPSTSAVGRLFDGVANLLGLIENASYEGQAASLLEHVASGAAKPVALPLVENASGLIRVDWQPLLLAMRQNEKSVAYRAMQFHQSLAHTIVAQAQRIQTRHAFNCVGLTGGVFQNKLLAELALTGLRQAGFDGYLPARFPCNDGGLALGQLIEASQHNG